MLMMFITCMVLPAIAMTVIVAAAALLLWQTSEMETLQENIHQK